jgi:hypothetical protein
MKNYKLNLIFGDTTTTLVTNKVIVPQPNDSPVKFSPFITSFFYNGSKETPEDIKLLFDIMAKVYLLGSDLFEDFNKEKLEEISSKLGKGTLIEKDNSIQKIWEFEGLWPHSVNFGDLCYSSSEEVEVEITWRFQKCNFKMSGKF